MSIRICKKTKTETLFLCILLLAYKIILKETLIKQKKKENNLKNKNLILTN